MLYIDCMPNDTAIKQKVEELIDVLKDVGLWQQQEPDWVYDYKKNMGESEAGFFAWLQFIYLPNLLVGEHHLNTGAKKVYIAPQAMPFFENDVTKKKLLRLFVELDSLTD